MIKHKGFYLSEIRVVGQGKKDAKVKLDKGLNVVSGGSNTGKSYILECIDYLFGAKNRPKPIPQAEGYKELFLEIKTWDEEKTFTLKRNFDKNKIEICEGTIDTFNKLSTKEMSITHSSETENISRFLLNICDLQDKKLKFNNRNVKKGLSFRNLTKICLIDEELIISKIPPIHTKILTQRTLEKSLFRLILSGKDDDELEEISDPKIIKNQIKGKLDYIKHEIENKNKEIYDTSKKIEGLDIKDINLKIDEITGIMNTSRKSIFDGEKEREIIWKEIEEMLAKKNHSTELKNRFILLKRHYESDIERLNFINEGSQYLSQLEDVSCPLCENKITNMAHFPLENKFLDSLRKELYKIKQKQSELQELLLENEKETELFVKQIGEKRLEFDKLNTYIENKIKPIIEIKEKELEDFLKLKEEKIRLSLLSDEVAYLNKEKDRLEEELQKKEKFGENITLEDEIYENFSKGIQDILMNWGMNFKVSFDKKAGDLLLDGYPRSSHGKGYRAIFTSAFMLGLLKYCLENSGKHPFFLVLDSPLTAYREGDLIEEGDINPLTIQEKFFLDFKKFGEEYEIQLFIVDNKEPQEEIKSLINYEHFSKNENHGRYGFYPLN